MFGKRQPNQPYQMTGSEMDYFTAQLSRYGSRGAWFEIGWLSSDAIDRLLELGYVYAKEHGGSSEAWTTYHLTEAGRAFVYEKNLIDDEGREEDAILEAGGVLNMIELSSEEPADEPPTRDPQAVELAQIMEANGISVHPNADVVSALNDALSSHDVIAINTRGNHRRYALNQCHPVMEHLFQERGQTWTLTALGEYVYANMPSM